MRNIEWTNNSKIANFWSQTLIFQIAKILKFLNFPIWTTPKTSSLNNSKNCEFGKLKKIQFGNFQKFIILKIKKKLKIRKFSKFDNL